MALSVIFLLVSGIPMDHPLPIWLLSTCMCITLISLALTFLFAAIMVTPNSIWNSVGNVFGIALIVGNVSWFVYLKGLSIDATSDEYLICSN
ncbi:hypothetical protein QL285_042208 [Trifolium repens]|nr:hypothetical protein QL285_042208 [Trifolium repens]